MDKRLHNISQAFLVKLKELSNTVIVSVAHRSNVNKWHNKILDFNTMEKTA